ncbi:helix-turn-helix domain-containing protein [Cupriavidus basilensis]
MKFQGLTLAEVLALVKASRSAWYRAMKLGDAPKPFKVTGARRVAWVRTEVEDYLARRVAERDAGSPAEASQPAAQISTAAPDSVPDAGEHEVSTLVTSKCWPLEGMSIAQKAVLICLADYADPEGLCWPSIPTIAKRVCASERAVQNAIKWLEAAKVVTANRVNGRAHQLYSCPPQNIHPRRKFTPAPRSPAQEVHRRSICTTPTQQMPGVPPQEMHQPPQEVPSNHQEPSVEPSGNSS